MQDRPTEFLDFTSLTLDEFPLLVLPFASAFQAHMAAWRLDGKPRTVRQFSVYKNCPLRTPEDRLFFILTYLKTYALQVVQGRLFGMRQALAAWHATGAAVVRPYGLPLLAESYAQVGRCEEGLTLLAEALALTNDREERRWEAELYRLKGELLLVHAAAHHAEAETCFRHALDIARRQQAKSWELRAATSLSRLWQQQGKQAEAHALLAPVYDWFTEGFDTADLQEAKVQLDELGA